MATQLIITLEPPDEIMGRVRPLVGSRPRFTPMETKACRLIQKPTPKAQNPAKWRRISMARRPMLNARQVNTANSAMMANEPAKPSSSAVTEKMKSVCASGR